MKAAEQVGREVGVAMPRAEQLLTLFIGFDPFTGRTPDSLGGLRWKLGKLLRPHPADELASVIAVSPPAGLLPAGVAGRPRRHDFLDLSPKTENCKSIKKADTELRRRGAVGDAPRAYLLRLDPTQARHRSLVAVLARLTADNTRDLSTDDRLLSNRIRKVAEGRQLAHGPEE